MPTTVPSWVLSRKRCSLDGSLLHCDPMNAQVYDLVEYLETKSLQT